MNKILILLGSKPRTKVDEFAPNPHEPYHVVFNFNLASTDPGEYVSDSEFGAYGKKVKSLEPDSDHPPLDEDLYIHVIEGGSFPLFGAEIPYPQSTDFPSFVVPNVHTFAHADRRGLLPKGFQTRIGFTGTGQIPGCYVFNYRFDPFNTRHLGVNMYPHPTTELAVVRLEYASGTQAPIYSDPYETDWDLMNNESPYLTFVIKEDRAELYADSPGVLLTELMLPHPLELDGPAHLDLFSTTTTDGGNIDSITLYNLLIYDAYL